MKRILSIEGDVTNLIDRLPAAKKLQDQLPTDLEMQDIPLQDLSTLAEQVHVATREAATNTDLDMQEFLGIDKALRRVQGEIINNTAKLSELDKQLDRDRGKLKEIKDDPSYSEELKERIQERMRMQKLNERLNLRSSAKQERATKAKFPGLKRLSAKILDSDTSLAEKLRTLFQGAGNTIAAILTAIGMIISTIVVSLTGGGGSGGGALNHKNKLVEWFKDKLKRLSDALKRLAGKAVAALPGIIRSDTLEQFLTS